MKLIRIGTRGSALALAQAAWVKAKLEKQYPERRVESIIIKTSGDRFVEAPVQAIGGKGIFTKEIEDALLKKEIDVAVHSMKDLPTELAPGLTVAAVPEREVPAQGSAPGVYVGGHRFYTIARILMSFRSEATSILD